MIIKWNGHSCFTITSGDYSLVVDPYKGVTGHPDVDLTANDVYASHDHYDHNYFEGVKLIPYEGEKPVTVRTVPCFHDECRGAKRGKTLLREVASDRFNRTIPNGNGRGGQNGASRDAEIIVRNMHRKAFWLGAK